MRRHVSAFASFAIGLALVALPQSARAQYLLERQPAVPADSAGAAVLRVLRADLTRLRLAQDSFYVAHRRYATDTAALGGWRPASGALIRIVRADSTGWAVEAEHRQWLGPEVLTVRRTADRPRQP